MGKGEGTDPVFCDRGFISTNNSECFVLLCVCVCVCVCVCEGLQLYEASWPASPPAPYWWIWGTGSSNLEMQGLSLWLLLVWGSPSLHNNSPCRWVLPPKKTRFSIRAIRKSPSWLMWLLPVLTVCLTSCWESSTLLIATGHVGIRQHPRADALKRWPL